MSNELLFSLCNNLALVSWIALIVSPRFYWTRRIVQSVIVILLTLLYSTLVFQSFTIDDLRSFGSLQGVLGLFGQPTAVLIGWVHYLAFDLMMGLYILASGQKHSVHHALLIPCLLFTFLLGPFGLLLFTIVRTIKIKGYWVEYI